MPHPRAALAAVLLVLLTAACTPEEPPTSPATPVAEPVVTASPIEPSPTPSSEGPVVVAPERPAALDDDGVEGAKAAVGYFVRLDAYIQKSNDTAAYEQMSHESCGTCVNRLDQANEIAKAGYEFVGGDAEVQVLHVYEKDSSTGIWPLDIRVNIAPVTVTDADGKTVFEQESVVDEQRFEVARSDDSWVVIAVVDLDDVPS